MQAVVSYQRDSEESAQSLLQEQQVFLDSEPSLQPRLSNFRISFDIYEVNCYTCNWFQPEQFGENSNLGVGFFNPSGQMSSWSVLWPTFNQSFVFWINIYLLEFMHMYFYIISDGFLIWNSSFLLLLWQRNRLCWFCISKITFAF